MPTPMSEQLAHSLQLQGAWPAGAGGHASCCAFLLVWTGPCGLHAECPGVCVGFSLGGRAEEA